jgi:Putative transposase of IS4/5 family (DUF4096)/Transposase DDE domain
MTTLADDLVSDELWALVQPLLPAPPRPPYGGRHRTISDRACLAAIVFMARELGCGSPTTCWRRLTLWAKPGSKLHLVCDGGGLPLTAAVTAANVADVTMLAAVVDDIPAVRTPRDGDGAAPPGSMPIRAMTAGPTGPGCGCVGSRRGSLGGRLSRQRGLDATAGEWSGRCRGLVASGGCRCAGIRMRGRWFAFVLVACAVVCASTGSNRIEE